MGAGHRGANLQARERTDHHVRQVTGRVSKVLRDCRWARWHEIDGGKLEQDLAGLRSPDGGGVNARTSNGYLSAMKQFCRWMVREGRSDRSPLEHMEPLNAEVDGRLVRRALSVEEVRRLLAATKGSGVEEGRPLRRKGGVAWRASYS